MYSCIGIKNLIDENDNMKKEMEEMKKRMSKLETILLSKL